MPIIEYGEPIPPHNDDRLIRPAPNWHDNACVNVTWGGDADYGYSEGYRRAARVLVEEAVERHRDRDYLVYPIFFLYRHHVELALKNIIRRIPYLLYRPLTQEEQEHLGQHRLDRLWQDLKPMFAEVCKAVGWDKLNRIEEQGVDSYIRQLTALDPDSYSFRYRRSKKGRPSLPSDLERIDLRHFAELMERLADYLDGLDTATSVLEEQKMDMEAEWRSEMLSEGY